MTVLPNFLIIGTAKAGTTSLMLALAQHPDVYFPVHPESNFFAFDNDFGNGLDAYKKKFEAGWGKVAIGEKSWRYSVSGVYPHALPRIVKHLPKQLRLIYLTRHPLERMESLWLDFRSSGQEHVPAEFDGAIREHPVFVDSCRYWKQINAYRDFFPDQQIQLLFFEDLIEDIKATTKSCFKFLGLREDITLAVTRKNVSSEKLYDSRGMDWLRKLPGFRMLRNMSPISLRYELRRLVKKNYQGRPRWNPATKNWVLDQIARDNQHFLAFSGKPLDYWNLS